MLPFAVVGTVGVQRLRDRLQGRARTAFVVVLVLLLLVYPLMFFSFGWPTQSTYVSNHQYELDGTRLALSEEAPYADEPFEYVSRNAAVDAAIIVDPVVFDRLIDGDGSESTLFGAAMTERNHFYGGRYPHYITYADRDQRNATRQAVLDCDPESIHDHAQSAVYVVVDSTREDCALDATLADHPHWTRVAADGDLQVFRHRAVDA